MVCAVVDACRRAGCDRIVVVVGYKQELVREALAGLGYGAEEIRDALRDLPSTGDAASLLRDALKLLGAKRA